MLAPVSEVRYGEEPLLALNLASAARWPAFAEQLAHASGRSVGYRRCGTLVVAVDDDDRRDAEELVGFQRELGLEVEWLTGRRVRDLERAVAPGVRAGIWVPGDHQVHNRMVLAALREAAVRAGVDVIERRAVAITIDAGAVRGVELDAGEALPAPVVVLAAGCRSADLAGLPAQALPAIRPVKGQIIRLAPTERAPQLGRTVRGIVQGASVYVVPRDDGSVVLGATVEEQGFDDSVTAGGLYELLRDAHRVVPGITEMSVTETAAGLRPGSPDNAPVVGAVDPARASGLVVASGHYRNGFLLAPVTAAAVGALVVGDEPPPEIAPFGPQRFATAPARAGG